MFIEILEKCKNDVEKYCVENDLSIDKVFSSHRSYNNDEEFLLHVGSPKGPVNGVWTIGGPPAPITLAIYLQDDGTLRFEQTEITRKYLGNEGCVEEPAGVAAMA